uniref:Protein Lines N-terminal domain-containing protein n=1 Tax=Rhodosorus marinus TaxID=101924 RepID=A0A7S0BGX4_9RHOD|mmetsp:Transcript_16309/g.23601  ORF Transcript_16309/g.23601 Transcript_16309/m.23601 type:complete len:285 (+) Transcript_16309:230-1084(+)
MNSETLFPSLAASSDSLCLYALLRFGRKALTYTSDQETVTRLGELCIRTDSEDLPAWILQRSMELLRLVLNRCSVLPGKVRRLPQIIQEEDNPRCYFAAAPKEVAHRIVYRAWLLVLFKMVEIHYSFHEHQKLDLTVEEDIVTSTDIFEVFLEQDDQLVESMLFGIQLWVLVHNLPDSEELIRTKEKYQSFDPDVMISRFLDFINFDTSLVCDWCFSNETETLRLLLMYLRNSVNPDESVVALFSDLRSTFQRLRAQNLWPFDVSPLVRRIEAYCSRFEDKLDS